MQKTITPVFERVGKRQKLVGFRAALDGVELGQLFASRDAAQQALDNAAYELLSEAAQ